MLLMRAGRCDEAKAAPYLSAWHGRASSVVCRVLYYDLEAPIVVARCRPRIVLLVMLLRVLEN